MADFQQPIFTIDGEDENKLARLAIQMGAYARQYILHYGDPLCAAVLDGTCNACFERYVLLLALAANLHDHPKGENPSETYGIAMIELKQAINWIEQMVEEATGNAKQEVETPRDPSDPRRKMH